jgi:hypothetical protein
VSFIFTFSQSRVATIRKLKDNILKHYESKSRSKKYLLLKEDENTSMDEYFKSIREHFD